MISDKPEMIDGDEVYVGSKSFHQIKQRVKDLIEFRHLIPIHQGRASE